MAINLEEILKLPVANRLKLVTSIWDSIAENPEALPLAAEQKIELDRRLDEIDAGDMEGIPWEEVMSRVQARLR